MAGHAAAAIEFDWSVITTSALAHLARRENNAYALIHA
jgi:hypothetical protein